MRRLVRSSAGGLANLKRGVGGLRMDLIGIIINVEGVGVVVLRAVVVEVAVVDDRYSFPMKSRSNKLVVVIVVLLVNDFHSMQLYLQVAIFRFKPRHN